MDFGHVNGGYQRDYAENETIRRMVSEKVARSDFINNVDMRCSVSVSIGSVISTASMVQDSRQNSPQEENEVVNDFDAMCTTAAICQANAGNNSRVSETDSIDQTADENNDQANQENIDLSQASSSKSVDQASQENVDLYQASSSDSADQENQENVDI